ncbi:ABC transporter permease [Sphingomonas sp. IC-56]|uniref:ABC transporter permease n=1 Tax=Sphingomonas sp. IC-56 TaxID=2898529 RepID=UPI001E60811E|nr:ABC transporter permease [Sphingomonas sp. IC-56]MCD2324378.1 ABC transporter permease [Sphingomonas sp. IC-56]
MRYATKLAVRHLLSSPGQSALLAVGVALGVTVFIFMSALIGGLATLLTQRTVGSIPHITIEMRDRDPRVLPVPGTQQTVVQKDLSRREQIAVWQPFVPVIEQTQGVTGVSPQIRGSAFIERGQAVAPVGVTGVTPGKPSVIADIEAALVSGEAQLPADGILIGRTLAEELGVRVGQVLRVVSDRGRERSFRIGGIFALGIASADRQAVYMNFTAARALFDLPTGVSRIEVKVEPVNDAPAIAETLRRATGLKVTPWTQENAQLFDALDAQGRTGTIIKVFALITIIVGISSAMLLSIVRRRAEIGILRAMGASKGLVTTVFVLEGTLIGATGAIGGALLAWAALAPFPPVSEVAQGGLPIDTGQGQFLLAVLLTTGAAALASILPARRAAGIDPVEAIGQ